MTWIWLVGALLMGYVVGSLPSAALVARFKKRDIFAVGSSSMGAMNTARNLGWALGALVLLLDLGKGVLASSVGLWFGALGGDPLVTPLIAGVGALTGHLWSVWVGFRGGKGLATTLGVALPIYPLGGLYGLAALLVFILIFRRVTLATFLTALFYPFGVYLSLASSAPPQILLATTLVASLIAFLVALKHVLPVRPVGGPRR